MENENKTPQKQPHERAEKKKRPQKPKSYFIEPATGAKPSAPSALTEKNEPQKNGENPERQKNAGANNNRPNKKKHNNNNVNNNNKDVKEGNRPQQTPSEKPKNPPTENKNTQTQQPDGNRPPRPNKNKHKNKPKNKTENAESANNYTANTEQKNDTAAKQNNPQKRHEKNNRDKAPASENAPKQKKRYEKPLQKPASAETTEINVDDYERVSFPSASEERKTEAVRIVTEEKSAEPVSMIEVVGVRFKSSGKMYYFAPGDKKLRRGEHAIVETARGLEYGDVAMGNTMVKEADTVPPLRPVVRVATPADIKHHEENKKKEDEAFFICNEKIIAHKLDMKLIDAQFTFDNSKLLFYFTSSGRVDFRELVKDLAGVFRTRIELRQIGIRDEAKIMGGVGVCGRPLCCTLFLSDFGQVSIKMAKEQNLSLNSAKISGICGRLMCCLRYEHETYEYEIKRTPPVDSLVQTADGTGIVTEISPLLGTVKVRLTASPETPPKTYKREDVVMLQKKNGKNN